MAEAQTRIEDIEGLKDLLTTLQETLARLEARVKALEIQMLARTPNFKPTEAVGEVHYRPGQNR
jgi:uncharacterized coiled-coil protein SlyX